MANHATSVAVLGASGYTGAELLRLLLDHPHVRITALCGDRSAGSRIDEVFPHLSGRLDRVVEAIDHAAIAERAEVVFLALPHAHAAAQVKALRAVREDLCIVDLSADFRLRDAEVYRTWYGDHPCAELLASAVYGLPELGREPIRTSRLIASPGCYPTASLLPIVPLIRAGLVRTQAIIVDAKSGVSGAGRSPSLAAHLPEAGEGIRPYKVAGGHRHTPEIEQELARHAGQPVPVLFTPHLVPMSRGILACVYAEASDPTRPPADYLDCLHAAYRDEPFVTVLSERLPDTAHVRGSNRAHLTVRFDARSGRILAMSAIDNLVKGAAGQAIQCMNLARGFDETAGLMAAPFFP